ncbi:hypothetical protein [Chlamydia pneumoniae]|uniref:hypothetical protein n=1 Tax=Chlamydia pneumoniae TaxID=83558 RepID=UPI0002E004A3|nr:hypothetical protein [Chlamydia pneumoniae]ETR80120.1 Phage internal scaffolding protein [Chlamydia pneumoniae B21]
MTACPIDYSEALNVVIEPQEQFESLPAKLRERFGNDPVVMLDFLSREENFEEAKKLGFGYANENFNDPQNDQKIGQNDAQILANEGSEKISK